MRGISIRMRLTMWYSTVLFVGLAGFGGGMSIALEHRLIKGVDEVLKQRVNGVRTTLQLEGQLSREQLQLELSEFARETSEGGLIELRDHRGWDLLPDPNGAAGPRFSFEPEGFRTESRQGHLYRVLSTGFTLAGHPYRTVVAGSLAGVHSVLRDFRRFLLLMIPGVLAVAGLGGYWISRRALAPVDQITRVATSISVHSLARRLEVPSTHDEIQRMSEAWNGVLERLESAVKRIQQFTADASHELRTPIALIRASAELALRRARSPGEYQETLRRIQSEAEHITELTESLLTLARADAGDAVMPLNRTDIPAVVASVMTLVEASAAEKRIRIEARSEAGQAIAMANEPALRRLLLILLDNALKHTPQNGQVVITTTRTDSGVLVEVADNGEGIPAEAVPHVFERFYRADTARGSGSGAGLGLSIAQAIAHAHRSAISVESEPGQGARFAFTLPV
jgi:two-component system heavy metal sensor histidine kinase CusS